MGPKRKLEDVLSTRSGMYKRTCHKISKPRKKKDSADSTFAGNLSEFNRDTSAARTVARIYVLVEAILVHLPIEDIQSCMASDKFFLQVAEDSPLVYRHVFGLLPPGHDTVWKIIEDEDDGSAKSTEVLPGSMRLDMALPPASARYVVPVTINEALLRAGGLRYISTPDEARRFYGQTLSKFTDDEVFAWMALRHFAPVYDYCILKVDVSTVPTGSRLLDEFFTSPPATEVQMRIRNPEGITYDMSSGRRFEDNFRISSVTGAKGVRLRDMVAEITEAGPEWLRQMYTLGVDSVRFQHDWAVTLGKWVSDFVDRQGMVYDPYPDEDE